MKSFVTLLIIIIILIGFFLIINRAPTSPTGNTATTTPNVTTEDYVRQHISELSPEPAVLGGTFYVTNIEAHGGAGTVKYEDGHIAFVADFTYDVDENGSTTIKTFTVRK